MLAPLRFAPLPLLLGQAALAQTAFIPASSNLSSANDERAIVLFDHDLDGDLDVVMIRGTSSRAIVVHERDENGDLLAVRVLANLFGSFNPRRLEHGDLNGDGWTDLVLGSEGRGIAWIEGTPQGTFENQATLSQFGRFWAIDTGDVDGDGDLDIVAMNEDENHVVLFRNGPAPGSFTPEIIVTGIAQSRDLVLHDMDGDGRLDLVIADPFFSRVMLFRGVPGGFGPRRIIAEGLIGPERILVDDFMGDDLPDVAVLTSTVQLSIIENGQPGFPWPRTAVPTSGQVFPRNFTAADFNGDGRQDFAYVDGYFIHRPLELLFNEGQGTFREELVEFSALQGSGQLGTTVATDRDGDGDMDLIISTRTGMVEYEQVPPVGSTFCPGLPNSTGLVARASLHGSDDITSNELLLRASDMPPGAMGLFAGSLTSTAPYVPMGSTGNLCLGTAGQSGIARFGAALGANDNGYFELVVDLHSMPRANGSAPALPGETWHFQAWFRDSVHGAATSGFTEGASILLR